jgi:OmpA-OmpF porin, OOP family
MLRPWIAMAMTSLAAGCTAPAPRTAAATKKYEAPDERFVFFVQAKADVLADGYFSIGYVTALLDADPSLHVLVVGHADARGKADQNRELSLKRARAVRKVLADHGIKEARIKIAAPRDPSDASQAELSRRADLFVYDPAQDDAAKRVGYPVDAKDD